MSVVKVVPGDRVRLKEGREMTVLGFWKETWYAYHGGRAIYFVLLEDDSGRISVKPELIEAKL